MQSACAWASIYSEADDGACCVAQRRIAKPLSYDAMQSSFRLLRAPCSHFVLLCEVCNSKNISKAFKDHVPCCLNSGVCC